jgi:hypothetical protein
MEALKHRKYASKIKIFEKKALLSKETIEKIKELIDKMSYIANEIKMDSLPTNPFIKAAPYGDKIIVFRVGDTLYNFRYYESTIIKYDDSEQEILMDNIKEKAERGEMNIDLTDNIYNNLIIYQIIVGYLYRCEGCINKLNLPKYEDLNKFTQNIVDLIAP